MSEEKIRIVTRPMYSTDKDYIKGMTVAIYEGTTDGSWIARNTDNILNSKVLKKLMDQNPGKVEIKHLEFDKIDKVLAGWEEDPARSLVSSDPKDQKATFGSWDEIFEFQSRKDRPNYKALKDWLKKHFETPKQKSI